MLLREHITFMSVINKLTTSTLRQYCLVLVNIVTKYNSCFVIKV